MNTDQDAVLYKAWTTIIGLVIDKTHDRVRFADEILNRHGVVTAEALEELCDYIKRQDEIDFKKAMSGEHNEGA